MIGKKLKLYSDKELISLIQIDKENLVYLYKQHKDYCLKFMNNIESNEDNIDVYQDAVIILYEKLTRDNAFNLTCSIQTYLNSICKNLVLKRFNRTLKAEQIDENLNYIIIEDQFDDYDEEVDEKIGRIEMALDKLKTTSEKCYEILVRFFYFKQSMELIAKDLNYTNADNVKNQKSRCQKKLKDITLNLS